MPLTRQYAGTFKVIRRHSFRKYFEIDIDAHIKSVSTKWLKPTHFLAEDISETFPEFLHLINPTPLSVPSTLNPEEPPDLPLTPEQPDLPLT